MSMDYQVSQVLGEYADEYDIPAIVRHITEHHDVTDIDDLSSDAFWAIANQHETDPAPDLADKFRAGLAEAIAAAGLGEAAVWTQGNVRVEVYGAARLRADQWPQPGAEVTISTPDGVTKTIAGDDVTSWKSLWDMVTAASEVWNDRVASLMDSLRARHSDMTVAQEALYQARAARDAAVHDAVGAGLTPYRIARYLGVAESTIGRIRAKR